MRDVLLLVAGVIGLVIWFVITTLPPPKTCPNVITDLQPLRVAVFTFDDVSGMYGRIINELGWDTKTGMADRLETYLVKMSKKFEVSAREELMDIVIDEISFQSLTGFVSSKTAVEFGQMTGINFIITAKITDFATQQIKTPLFKISGSAFTVDYRIVNVETGKIALADTVSGWTIGGDIEKSMDWTTVNRAAQDTADKMAKAIAMCVSVQ